jgi:hypothetical protein
LFATRSSSETKEKIVLELADVEYVLLDKFTIKNKGFMIAHDVHKKMLDLTGSFWFDVDSSYYEGESLKEMCV